jgi:hypothetical protein
VVLMHSTLMLERWGSPDGCFSPFEPGDGE